MKKNVPDKTNEEILKQLYISAYDLQLLIPGISYATSLKYIKVIREEMEKKNMFQQESKSLLAFTKLVRKKFGV